MSDFTEPPNLPRKTGLKIVMAAYREHGFQLEQRAHHNAVRPPDRTHRAGLVMTAGRVQKGCDALYKRCKGDLNGEVAAELVSLVAAIALGGGDQLVTLRKYLVATEHPAAVEVARCGAEDVVRLVDLVILEEPV